MKKVLVFALVVCTIALSTFSIAFATDWTDPHFAKQSPSTLNK